MCGLAKTGKTSVVKAILGQEVPTDYEQTNETTEYNTIMKVNDIDYKFTFYDTNGTAFEEEKGTSVLTTVFAKGKIHIYVVNKEEEDTIEAMEGYFKAFSIEEIKVDYRIMVVTRKDVDCPDVTKKIRSFAPEDTKIFEVNALKDGAKLKEDLCAFLARATMEHPEIFEGCENQPAAAPKKDDKKGAKKEKKSGEGKKKCVIC